MNTWLLVAIIAVGAVALIIKRLIGEPINVRDLFGPAVVLTALGIWSVAEVKELNGTDIGWVLGGSVISLGFGLVRGSTVVVFEKNEVLHQRYTPKTFLVIVAAFVASALYGLLAKKMGMHEDARPMNLSIGIGFLGEALVIGYRGLLKGGNFAPEKPSLLDKYTGRGDQGRQGPDQGQDQGQGQNQGDGRPGQNRSPGAGLLDRYRSGGSILDDLDKFKRR
ncbi:DUF1453 domain-containing protein [Streptomyces sp. CBMA156]|uniref:DUF1453 domain-containing protein n=1 Tax=Streptomyces sp. CBMA156 TaxID=1930280 RepID=UPI001661C247|nr:DUF1453 domain-containing protein [Streptomyces sp. CBMA156]MBD0676969.1 hypothetical protein [Streptomyces sp. CBMA156]